MKTPKEYLIEKRLNGFANHTIVDRLIKDYTLYILSQIFENGLGNLDENSSKDDLVEEYLRIKEELK